MHIVHAGCRKKSHPEHGTAKRFDRHPFFANVEWRKFRMLETVLFIFMQGHLTFVYGKYAHHEHTGWILVSSVK
jgi:hypothetical protein